MFEKTNIIHQFTRADAIQAGVLIDVAEQARDCGFAVPVALSVTLFQHLSTDERIIAMLETLHALIFVAGDGESDRFQFQTFGAKALCHIGPGDRGEAVMTIGLPDDF